MASLETCLLEFVIHLQDHFVHLYPNGVYLRTEHERSGTMFRGNAKYRNEVWRDWVLINWGEDGNLPCKIWGYVDLSLIRGESGVSYGGLASVTSGVYAIVEAGRFVNSPAGTPNSNMFTPIRKEVGAMQGNNVTKLKFYLADVEAFVAPMVVVPDIGGNPYDYLAVKNKTEWCNAFIERLNAPLSDDIIDEDL